MSQFNDCDLYSVCKLKNGHCPHPATTPLPRTLSVSLQHRQLDIPLEVLEGIGSKVVSDVSKADPVHAEQLIPLLQPTILPRRSVHEDLVDEDGEVPVSRALAPHDAEAQALLASVEHYDLNAVIGGGGGRSGRGKNC